MATVYRLLSDEGKAVAREKARARYQQIKKPKRSTLESHGFRETPEGWADLEGQVVLPSSSDDD